MRCILLVVLYMQMNVLVAQRPFDLIINEILFDPKPGGTDYIELYNRSKQNIYLKNIKLATRNSNGQVSNAIKITSSEKMLLPDEYCLLTADSFSTARQFTILNADAVVETKLPSMPDDEGHLLLLNEHGIIIEELHYKDDWHFALLNEKEGVALERIHFNDSTQKPSNWHSASSTSGYGTPGYRNSQAYIQQQMESRFQIEPEVFSPDNNGQDVYVTIAYQFPEQGYVISLTIYNSRGIPVRFLARNVLCGIKGFFKWDGLDENVKRLSSGIYVLLIAAFNLNGVQTRMKKTITLVRN
jgi:hypothetical protein